MRPLARPRKRTHIHSYTVTRTQTQTHVHRETHTPEAGGTGVAVRSAGEAEDALSTHALVHGAMPYALVLSLCVCFFGLSLRLLGGVVCLIATYAVIERSPLSKMHKGAQPPAEGSPGGVEASTNALTTENLATMAMSVNVNVNMRMHKKRSPTIVTYAKEYDALTHTNEQNGAHTHVTEVATHVSEHARTEVHAHTRAVGGNSHTHRSPETSPGRNGTMMRRMSKDDESIVVFQCTRVMDGLKALLHLTASPLFGNTSMGGVC